MTDGTLIWIGWRILIGVLLVIAAVLLFWKMSTDDFEQTDEEARDRQSPP